MVHAVWLLADYASFALKASMAGSMAMMSFLAWRVATSGKRHSQPAVSAYALMGPAQASIINSKLASQQNLRHRGLRNGKIR